MGCHRKYVCQIGVCLPTVAKIEFVIFCKISSASAPSSKKDRIGSLRIDDLQPSHTKGPLGNRCISKNSHALRLGSKDGVERLLPDIAEPLRQTKAFQRVRDGSTQGRQARQ